jgi:hypothetical protein
MTVESGWNGPVLVLGGVPISNFWFLVSGPWLLDSSPLIASHSLAGSFCRTTLLQHRCPASPSGPFQQCPYFRQKYHHHPQANLIASKTQATTTSTSTGFQFPHLTEQLSLSVS